MLSVPKVSGVFQARQRAGRGVPWGNQVELAEGRPQQEPWGPSGAQGWRDVTEAVSRPALSSSVFLPVSRQPHPLCWPRPSAGCLARVGTRQGTRVTEKRHQLTGLMWEEPRGQIGPVLARQRLTLATAVPAPSRGLGTARPAPARLQGSRGLQWGRGTMEKAVDQAVP